MAKRIVLFGATGYTGELTARAMVRRGLNPVLAARRPEPLHALAAELGGLETAIADVDRPRSVRALVDEGDVLVTTVGPMVRFGEAALEAALDAGAHYVDSTGESAFVRRVFEGADARARARGCALLPAMAYDSVPGNLAASLAVREAGEAATCVRVGYFVTGARRRGLFGGLGHMSGGSRATFVAMALEPGFVWRDRRLVTERGSARVGVFEIDGQRRHGVSFGTSEAYSLPQVHSQLRDVKVYFGWFEGASRLVQVASFLASPLGRVPGARAAMDGAARRLAPGSTGGPTDEDTGSLFVAEALSPGGECLAWVGLEGINGYRFSGNMLAWTAEQLAAGNVAGVGVLGPVEAFGIDALEVGVDECGIAKPDAPENRAAARLPELSARPAP